MAADAHAGTAPGGVEVDTKYGSEHRANMRQHKAGTPVAGNEIELMLVFNAANSAGTSAVQKLDTAAEAPRHASKAMPSDIKVSNLNAVSMV